MIFKCVITFIACSFILNIAYAGSDRNVDLLVSSCAACHGTNGYSVGGTPRLAGLSQAYFTEQMQQFVSGERKATVMFHHASGYTAEEISLMADFFANQTEK